MCTYDVVDTKKRMRNFEKCRKPVSNKTYGKCSIDKSFRENHKTTY